MECDRVEVEAVKVVFNPESRLTSSFEYHFDFLLSILSIPLSFLLLAQLSRAML